MMRNIVHFLAFTILFIPLLTDVHGADWYVDRASTGKPADGKTWATAFKKIQAGIDAAQDGDTVIVAEGTYVENVNFGGKNVTLRSTHPTDWNVVKETIIDGNKAGSVVTFFGTEDETCVLCGFTIRNGTGVLAPGETGLVLSGGGIIGVDPVANPAGTPFAHATIQNNIIADNSADNGAGLCFLTGVTRNNIITGNWSLDRSSDHCGGAIGFCNGTVENNLIVANFAGCGGAISFSNVDFRNNVVVGNTSSLHGGGLAHVATSPYTPPGGSITNCIIWGNSSPTGPQVHGSVAPSHCCIQDWTGGGDGNISLNPRFVDPDGPDGDPSTFEDNDYRLLAASRCIDAGENEDWMQQAVDLNGNPRILVGASSLIVDMGAYEYRFAVGKLTRQPEGTVELTWDNRGGTRYAIWSCMGLAPEAWTEEGTILPKESVVTWTDADPAAPRKFYRIELK